LLKNLNQNKIIFLSYFIYSANELIKKYALSKASGSTFLEISSKVLGNMDLLVPEYIEQEKIGEFFENIDSLITEHQQKHVKLKSLKQAMLGKMFPKQGQLVPEIRFKGFEGDWEEKKLSELSNYSNGKGYESFQSKTGKYELISLNSISIDGGLKPSGKFISHADTTLKENDLVMILSDVGHGDLLGRVALIPADDKYVLNQRVALLRPNKDISPYFLYYNINANQLYFKTQGAGMSQLNLSKKSVEDFTSLIPKEIDEQIEIADYFINIDHLIVNHGTQISKLQNIKKAFLAKMFI
jgi:type I restriction enzyme S subunit